MARTAICTEVNGEHLTLREISRIYDMPLATVRIRYHNGLRGDDLIRYEATGVRAKRARKERDALETEPRKVKYTVVMEGRIISLKEVERVYKVDYHTLLSRYHAGKRDHDLLTEREWAEHRAEVKYRLSMVNRALEQWHKNNPDG